MIRKLFIKDYKNYNDEKVRIKHGIYNSILGISFNLLLFVMKLVAGILSNSISVIGDAINNLTDMGSSIISFFGFKISSKPADKDHPYGHQRVEYITGLIISVIIIVVGVQLFSSSITKIFSNDIVKYTNITLIVLVFSILIKLYLAINNFSISKKTNSITLKAAGKDSLNDVISTTLILISAIIAIKFNLNIDGYMGVFVSIFIFYSGVSLIKETVSPLIGEKVDSEKIKEIIDEILKEEIVIGVHDLMCHSYGPNNIFMSIHVEVDASLDIIYIHEVIDNIEFKIKDKFKVHLVIHMDPINLNCDLTNSYKEIISKELNNISKLLTFHDFRAVVANTHINLIFDIVRPIDLKITEDEIIKTLNRVLSNKEVHINLIISFDNDFSTLN